MDPPTHVAPLVHPQEEKAQCSGETSFWPQDDRARGRRSIGAENSNSNLRFGTFPIEWSHPKISQGGFQIPQRQDLDEQAWQFSLSEHESGRVHGFLIDRVFHVVWLDPDHNLYPWEAR
jgi:hypothetical protein